MTYLLDTSVYSQPLKNKPLAKVLRRWSRMTDAQCRVSRVCLAEVEFGLAKESSPDRIARFHALLRSRLPILPVSDEIWQRWAAMKARQAAIAKPVPDLDLLIAATAVHHGLILATLNARHFSKVEGLQWEDWG